MLIDLVLAVATVLTSIVSGVLGMAGGVALLGVMVALMPASTVVPLHGMVQFFSNFSRTLILLREVVWREALTFIVPCVAGVALGAYFGRGMRFSWLEPVIGALLIVFVWWRRHMANRRVHALPLVLYAATGFVVGLASLFIGATGPLSALVFRRDDWTPRQVVASMAVVQSVGHLLKLPAFMLLGFDFAPHMPLLFLLLVSAIAGTYIGRHVLDRISPERFGLIFDVVLVCLALWLVGHGVYDLNHSASSPLTTNTETVSFALRL